MSSSVPQNLTWSLRAGSQNVSGEQAAQTVHGVIVMLRDVFDVQLVVLWVI